MKNSRAGEHLGPEWNFPSLLLNAALERLVSAKQASPLSVPQSLGTHQEWMLTTFHSLWWLHRVSPAFAGSISVGTALYTWNSQLIHFPNCFEFLRGTQAYSATICGQKVHLHTRLRGHRLFPEGYSWNWKQWLTLGREAGGLGTPVNFTSCAPFPGTHKWINWKGRKERKMENYIVGWSIVT